MGFSVGGGLWRRAFVCLVQLLSPGSFLWRASTSHCQCVPSQKRLKRFEGSQPVPAFGCGGCRRLAVKKLASDPPPGQNQVPNRGSAKLEKQGPIPETFSSAMKPALNAGPASERDTATPRVLLRAVVHIRMYICQYVMR